MNRYSPVSKIQTLKVLLAYCCQNGTMIKQLDVETAFLNGKLNSEVYVKQPLGFNDGADRVYKLHKALYRLRESSRLWYEYFDEFMRKLKFKKNEQNYYFYFRSENGKLILLFVDDLLVCSKDRNEIMTVRFQLKIKFKMRNMDQIKTYKCIGIDIKYDC